MIIALVGHKECGKDTVANYLVKYGFTKYSLADPMKVAAKEIFLFTDRQLWGDQKEIIDERYNTTPRKILQVMGTELFQFDIYKYIPELKIPLRKLWIYRFKQWLFNELRTRDFGDFDVVISDVRFPHEAEEIKKMNGIVVRIYRHLPSKDNHVSETEMEEIAHDYAIFNFGTIEELYVKIDKLVRELNGKIHL